jgi:hypothetical protein
VKHRKKIAIGLGLLMAGIMAAALSWFSPRDERMKLAAEETREKLRAEGFKTDLVDFNFFTSPEMRAREKALTNGSLPDARRALLEGPIAFHLDASRGSVMLLPHLAPLKNLQKELALEAQRQGEIGNYNEAFTNLLAMSRVVTTWEIEPTEISHLVRFSCLDIAFEALAESSLGRFDEQQLATLQETWANADFLKRLPEIEAFNRARLVNQFVRTREESLEGISSPSEWIRHPSRAYYEIKGRRDQTQYRLTGSYEDERDALLFFRDREVQVKAALALGTWDAMRFLSIATNQNGFTSKHPSTVQAMLNAERIRKSFQWAGSSFLAKAARTETRRRLIVSAIALERYRLRNDKFPVELEQAQALASKDMFIDYMDGKPLRYTWSEGGKFRLYSVGLDCVEDGGKAEGATQRQTGYRAVIVRAPIEPDIVWPDKSIRSD